VSRVISVADSQRLVFDLRQLHQLIAADAPLTVEARLEPGDRVRVRQGPLLGLEGTVLVRRNRTRLLIAVDFLQQGASVEIDDFLLEPLN
jgi:transcription antitermination factor NusG